MSSIIDNMAPCATTDTSPLSKRRRFAPHEIPNFIPCSDNSDIANHTFNSPLLFQLCEQAPSQAEVEASLLQVGMRVRKSVNDGYKVVQKKFTPRPFANNLHRLSPETQQALFGQTEQTHEVSPYADRDFSPLARQPLSTATFCGINLAALAYKSDDWSDPAISKQTLWSYTTSFKRFHDGDSDSDESQEWLPQTPTLTAEAGQSMPLDYFNIDIENFSNVSPFTQPGDVFQQQLHGRRLAKPKSRIRLNRTQEIPMPPTSAINPFSNLDMHQQEPSFAGPARGHFGHTRMRSCGIEANLNDFAEASFLQRREDVEMDCS